MQNNSYYKYLPVTNYAQQLFFLLPPRHTLTKGSLKKTIKATEGRKT